jgi:hypothetical protein
VGGQVVRQGGLDRKMLAMVKRYDSMKPEPALLARPVVIGPGDQVKLLEIASTVASLDAQRDKDPEGHFRRCPRSSSCACP